MSTGAATFDEVEVEISRVNFRAAKVSLKAKRADSRLWLALTLHFGLRSLARNIRQVLRMLHDPRIVENGIAHEGFLEQLVSQHGDDMLLASTKLTHLLSVLKKCDHIEPKVVDDLELAVNEWRIHTDAMTREGSVPVFVTKEGQRRLLRALSK